MGFQACMFFRLRRSGILPHPKERKKRFGTHKSESRNRVIVPFYANRQPFRV